MNEPLMKSKCQEKKPVNNQVRFGNLNQQKESAASPSYHEGINTIKDSKRICRVPID
jgi:hypothetical protein